MKQLFKYLVMISLMIWVPIIAQAAEKFTFDHKHSYILWKAKHFDFSSQTGKWYINGQMTLDKDHPEKSSVEATVQLSDLITGLPDFDKHLKSKDFLHVQQYPIAKFISEKVDITGDNTAKVTGQLTLHGITKPVTLDVKLNKVGVSPVNEKPTVGFTAKTTLKRSNFGITAFIPGVSDEVEIYIQVEANQPKPSDA